MQTALIGAVGAFIGYLVSLPLYPIIGPAILISLLSLAGVRSDISTLMRDVAFIFLGINIGSGVDPSSLSSMLSWPIAFVALIFSLIVIIIAGLYLLKFGFGFESRSAILSSSPGHLSYVLGLATAHGSDVSRVAIIQSLRLLLLTLSVPFIALAFGVDVSGGINPAAEYIQYVQLGLLIASAALLGILLGKLRVPAAFLLGGMIVSTFGHVTNWTPGVLPLWISIPSFIVLGSLIGSRFSGMTLNDIKKVLFAGSLLTAATVAISIAFAIPVAFWLGMPIVQVLVAFAPGGMETMIIMGAILGADPGFLAACHVTRLFLLSVIVPFIIARTQNGADTNAS